MTQSKKLGECQINWSTFNNIFIPRNIFEKCYESSINLHNALYDYTQAFDSVYRNKTIEGLVKYKFPTNLIRLIQLILTNTTARFKINIEYTEKFKLESSLKQVDSLSATSLSVVTDATLKQSELRRFISTRLTQCSLSVNDILITTRTKQLLLDTLQKSKKYILD